ncbi:hypothetical protein CJP74_04790 [Psittacicella melopsittaci]|uniref:Uncharacterized protein n=1 Tax=Psittacicella melopsittaci TaxID=2028576 RepID=A0A3A1Y873_9GAMM|nr:hypothetical protein [Psittacicella melopsittaci]RIY32317.1 hypothetical protein CJP74_04790 [Psittacicella melopsittaci]
MFNNLFEKASSIVNAAKDLKDLDLNNPSQLLDQIKSLDFDTAKEKLQSIIPALPITKEQITSLLDKLSQATANNETIHEVVEKLKSLLSATITPKDQA